MRMRLAKRIEANVPVITAYNQWTQLETLPAFLRGLREVRRLNASRFWLSGSPGAEGYVRVTRQVPDRLIAWRSEDGPVGSVTIVFRPTAPGRTEIGFYLKDGPEGGRGMPAGEVEGGLERFKRFIEERRMETGAWRGEIMHGRELPRAPLEDSSDAPDEDQIRFGVSPLDSGRMTFHGDIMT